MAGVDIGDKRSYVRLVGLDGELLQEVKISANPAAIEKYFRSWLRLRVVLENGGQTNWIRRLIAGLVPLIFDSGAGNASGRSHLEASFPFDSFGRVRPKRGGR